MKSEMPAGFREIEHTADWELRVWAPDLAALLEQAARGMYNLQGASLKSGPRLECRFKLAYQEPETLLVDFLAELLYLLETERLAFDQFELSLTDDSLEASLSGAPIESLAKEIKAVTYHNLEIKRTESGFEANVVFDV
jgi:SHS2 domain-containing protein